MKYKLKPIPQNTVVHTPTEAEAKELLAILHENGLATESDATYPPKNAEGIQIDSETYWSWWAKIENARKINRTILTLAEFKERYCEMTEQLTEKTEESSVTMQKPRPKLNVGDRVWAKIYQDEPPYIGTVTFIRKDKDYEVDIDEFKGQINKQVWCCRASDLEPYTEPETKDGTKETKDGTKETKDGTKDLNLCELLKGHEGEEFYSLAHGDVMLDHISPTTDSCIAIKKRNRGIERFYRDGRWLRGGIVMLFPSRALYEQYPLDPYRAWLKWKEGQKKEYGLGVVLQNMNPKNCEVINGYTLLFHTSADRKKYIEEIKAIIEKYSKK